MPLYVGKKYDKIDVALGTFLNKYPDRDRMKILFLRESEGVYRFGAKRVYIKIEKGDEPYVRVGGGYLHVQEFIEQYTEAEVQKNQCGDVVQRFQNKV